MLFVTKHLKCIFSTNKIHLPMVFGVFLYHVCACAIMAAGGYEYDFSSKLPDRIVCKICHCPSRDPYLSVCCGHVFCKTCIDQVKRSSLSTDACPMCRDEEFPTVPNKQIDREVKSLIVSCTNKEKGCTWKGEVRAVEVHVKTCAHELVQCEYHNVGCKAKMCRKDLKQHNKLKMEEHLALNTLKLKNLERLVYRLAVNDISETTEHDDFWLMQLDSLAAITASSGDQVCPVILKMPGFAATKKNEEKWFSDPFYTHSKGYKVCLCVDTEGFDDDGDSADSSDDGSNSSSTHLSISLYLMKGLYDDKLTWPLQGEFKVTLLNQASDDSHHSETVDLDEDTPAEAVYRVMDDDRADEGFGDDEFISHDDFYDTTCNRYIKNDNIFFQIAFEISR